MTHTHETLRTFTKTSEVGDLVISRDTALAIYNQIATKCGKPNLDTVGAIYAVEVSWNDGTSLLNVEEVEAEDEDEAIDIVREGILIEDVSVSLSLSFMGNRNRETVFGLDWELDSLINESLEFRATEL